MNAPIRVGIGGWTFAPWPNNFYPAGLPHAQELTYASQHLTAIEINGTFYRHQSPQSFAAWRDATPDDFVFSVKAHRATTHGRDIAASGPAIERFVGSGLAELELKLGPILWQFAHTKKFDHVDMETFIGALPDSIGGVKLRHAVEARHPTFLDPAWPELARRHNVAIAIMDSDEHTLRTELTADFVYASLQRNDAAAPEGYDSAALDGWAQLLRDWSAGDAKRPCFAFFISRDKPRAPHAAMAMAERLRKEVVLF